MMNSNLKTLLVLGGHATGKTHYGAQLLGRLNQKECKLKMRGVSKNLTPFEEALNCLGQGMAAGHTKTNIYHSIELPIEMPAGQSVDLIWPDYGGEQISNIVIHRHVEPGWQERLVNSNGWLLFLRLENIMEYEDPLSRPQKFSDPVGVENKSPDAKWSTSAFFIELLQILLYSKGVGTLQRVKNPSLVILLSCWDEISNKEEFTKPHELLLRDMPLFFNYIEAMWEPEHLSIFGLSSTGKALSKDEPDEEYIKQGAENFGWVILPDGTQNPDLTLPILDLMERIG